MNAAFPNGIYTLQISANLIVLNLGTEVYPVIPLGLPSAGSWVGGKLRISEDEAASGFSVDSNPSTSNGFLTLEVYGENNNYELFDLVDGGPASLHTAIPGGALVKGGLYTVEIEFDHVVAAAADDQAFVKPGL